MTLVIQITAEISGPEVCSKEKVDALAAFVGSAFGVKEAEIIGVVKLSTEELTPEVLAKIQAVEEKLGRDTQNEGFTMNFQQGKQGRA